ncbi:hypothetical protein GS534_00540 [Rhodococcus hoagii]|nr:hypothetical protein [Prescottella equi]
MANNFVTPQLVAQRALANLYENLCALPLVYTDHSQEFSAGKGDTVNVRKPAVLTASDFDSATGIALQDITETSLPVKLDKIADISVPVTSKQMTLDIDSFEEQVVVPAAMGLAQHIDRAVLAMRSQIVQEVGTAAGFELNKPEVLIDADKVLNLRNVPSSERRAIVGPTTRAHWLNSDIIKHADKSGSTSALREGSIGRNLFGFEAFMTQNIGQRLLLLQQVSRRPRWVSLSTRRPSGSCLRRSSFRMTAGGARSPMSMASAFAPSRSTTSTRSRPSSRSTSCTAPRSSTRTVLSC